MKLRQEDSSFISRMKKNRLFPQKLASFHEMYKNVYFHKNLQAHIVNNQNLSKNLNSQTCVIMKRRFKQ
jgi:hypothetical protein